MRVAVAQPAQVMRPKGAPAAQPMAPAPAPAQQMTPTLRGQQMSPALPPVQRSTAVPYVQQMSPAQVAPTQVAPSQGLAPFVRQPAQAWPETGPGNGWAAPTVPNDSLFEPAPSPIP